jgi:hypothetical protein
VNNKLVGEKEEQKERNLSKNEKGTYSYDAIIGY